MAEPAERQVMAEPEIGADLPIHEVSQLLQVPAPTIRSWERRYGVPSTGRTTGGHRRFLPAEITSLRLMRDEIARGRRAAEAAVVVRASGHGDAAYQLLIDNFLSAAHRLDSTSLTAGLELARQEVGLDAAIGEVVLPAMRQIGVWWQTGRCDVAHEHLATETVRAWLNRLLYLEAKPSQPELVLLSCGPRDLHTIGLEAMGVLLAHRGWPCRVLGARTPATSLAKAVDVTGASAVVLTSHLSVGRRSAVEALRTVEPLGAAIFYAGNAFTARQARNGVPGTYLGEDVASAADQVTTSLTSRRATEPA
jgi:MerR family transcriptional regulator, light-induced transcriptional regulator